MLRRTDQTAMAEAYERALAGDAAALIEARQFAARINDCVLRGHEDAGTRRAKAARGGSPEGTGQGRKDQWVQWEIELLHDPDMATAEIARRTNRTHKAIWLKRRLLLQQMST